MFGRISFFSGYQPFVGGASPLVFTKNLRCPPPPRYLIEIYLIFDNDTYIIAHEHLDICYFTLTAGAHAEA
jgi:hypothetical protein